MKKSRTHSGKKSNSLWEEPYKIWKEPTTKQIQKTRIKMQIKIKRAVHNIKRVPLTMKRALQNIKIAYHKIIRDPAPYGRSPLHHTKRALRNIKSLMWLSRVSFEWVMSRMIVSCHTYEWGMSPVNESCLIWLSHVSCEWVMSRMTQSCQTYEWFMSGIILRNIKSALHNNK